MADAGGAGGAGGVSGGGGGGGHPKLSFAAAARAVATSSNKEKFERLKDSRDKAKAKLAEARVEITRLQQEAAASAGSRAASSGALRRENGELRRALLAQLPEGEDGGDCAAPSAERLLRAALGSEQRLRAEALAELAHLRGALWGTSGLACAALLALAYTRLTRA